MEVTLVGVLRNRVFWGICAFCRPCGFVWTFCIGMIAGLLVLWSYVGGKKTIRRNGESWIVYEDGLQVGLGLVVLRWVVGMVGLHYAGRHASNLLAWTRNG